VGGQGRVIAPARPLAQDCRVQAQELAIVDRHVEQAAERQERAPLE
jgi:hypothetical protein